MGRKQRPDANVVNGILLVDKPAGMTSHDVVHKIRKGHNLSKVGHGGTLDPQATGLLVLLLGRGTKSSDQIMRGDKTYEGTLVLGVTTDSQDADGEVVEERDAAGVSREDVEKIVMAWDGEIEQIPPMVSAIKKGGVPLYKLARQGKTIEREPRLVRLYDPELLSFEHPEASFSVSCGKGTYVRTLAHDLGEALGCGAHLSALRRTRSGDYSIDGATELQTLLDADLETFTTHVLPVPDAPPKDT